MSTFECTTFGEIHFAPGLMEGQIMKDDAMSVLGRKRLNNNTNHPTSNLRTQPVYGLEIGQNFNSGCSKINDEDSIGEIHEMAVLVIQYFRVVN